jgi:hypothetical protein
VGRLADQPALATASSWLARPLSTHDGHSPANAPPADGAFPSDRLHPNGGRARISSGSGNWPLVPDRLQNRVQVRDPRSGVVLRYTLLRLGGAAPRRPKRRGATSRALRRRSRERRDRLKRQAPCCAGAGPFSTVT